MTVTVEEKEFINSLPKRLVCCPKLQAEKERRLRAALLAEFNDDDIADRAMRVIKGMR